MQVCNLDELLFTDADHPVVTWPSGTLSKLINCTVCSNSCEISSRTMSGTAPEGGDFARTMSEKVESLRFNLVHVPRSVDVDRERYEQQPVD